VEHGEQVGRYSFLGFEPARELQVRGREVTIAEQGRRERYTLEAGRDPLDAVAAELAPYQPLAPLHDRVQDLPYFVGGAVGFLGYDVVRAFERLPRVTEDDRRLPDLHLLIADTLVAYDHARKRIVLFATVRTPPGADLDAAYDRAAARLDRMEARLRAAVPPQPPAPGRNGHTTTPRTPQGAFETAVRTAKDYITAGDIFQVVVSQRLERPTDAQPFAIYRALRRLNPSPYMFYLDLGGDPATRLIGSSPEMLVRLQGRSAEVRPIAGTRPRGRTAEEDAANVRDLQDDPKERAEHVMLVDLGRNDIGRVAEFGSVEVPELLEVERYSHVIHLVSRVKGRLREDLDGYDLLRATFPAGTVSGAPKVRAMEIIEELEPVRRGPYAGAVGYLGFSGNLDTCITIRTIVMQDDRAHLQAGAGIVADSDPTREWEETGHKARALGTAIEMAEEGR
jgi:anthranilate synthase component 1